MRLCDTNALCVHLHQSTDWNSVCVRESEERGEEGDAVIERNRSTRDRLWERRRGREWCSDKCFTLRVYFKCLRGKDPQNIKRSGVGGAENPAVLSWQVNKKTKCDTYVFPLCFFPPPQETAECAACRLRVCAEEWWKFRNVWGSLSGQEGDYEEEESSTCFSLPLRSKHIHKILQKAPPNKGSHLNKRDLWAPQANMPQIFLWPK